MKCIVCHQRIDDGDNIFWGTQMVCSGPGENDCYYSRDSEGLVGATHLSCLGNPVEAAITPNMTVPELVEEESIAVQRSDALSVFDLSKDGKNEGHCMERRFSK